MASRAESRLSRLNSAASSMAGPDKASVDEVFYNFSHPLPGGDMTLHLKHLVRRRVKAMTMVVAEEQVLMIPVWVLG